ncbi:MAG: hypothetical protein H8E55_13435 [Pelagibacterales bacterium]|nr:hypothetical protein [Pelagibacterales bacterium]
MNCKNILLIFFLILTSCVNTQVKKENNHFIIKNYFSNKGFALVYSDTLKKEKKISNKLDDRSLIIFQKNLKKNTIVKITNLSNKKSIIVKVGKKSDYPIFYNSVISIRISETLEIDQKEPYVEIKELLESSSFIAKKSKTFDEEKNVAAKAPVESIKIKDLTNNIIKNEKVINKKFLYIIKIADFYFEKSAKDMILRIKKETVIKKVKINKISSNKFRVFLGPFKNLNSLKNEFDAINTLQFENIEIIKI